MKNFIIRILTLFIFNSHKRKEFRNKYSLCKAKIRGNLKDNSINIPTNRNIEIFIEGKNNQINIDKDLNIKSKITINLYGDNNKINIGKAHAIINLQMGYNDGRQIHNSNFIFGETYSEAVYYLMIEDDTTIKIGNNCMFSNNIEFRCTDDHTVLDLQGNVLNKAKNIIIGDHVWICKDVLILKNTTIPDNSIVGAKSVVAKRFEEPNIVLVGNPARIVKTGINWDGARADLYKKSRKPNLSTTL